MNQFTFKITNPSDRLSKPFISTWIHGDTETEAREILSRTYQPKYGFVLTLQSDLNKARNQKLINFLAVQSFNSAQL